MIKHLAAIMFLVGIMLTDHSACAQDTLPSFTATNRNGRIILNWVNNFPVVKQLSIQRSSDSLKGFKTILTLPDPTAITNGFLDNNAPDTVLFYKLYILLDSGQYVFSKSKRPEKREMQPAQANTGLRQERSIIAAGGSGTDPGEANEPAPEETASGTVNIAMANVTDKKRSDVKMDAGTRVAAPAEVVKPSSFVFTNPEGNITIVLPKDKFRQFSIRFFDPEGDPAFAINTIKEHIIIVDKSNFMRSGTFRFELYENGAIKEKNFVQVPRFKSAK